MISALRSSFSPRTVSRILKNTSPAPRWVTPASTRLPTQLIVRSFVTSLRRYNQASSSTKPHPIAAAQEAGHTSLPQAPTQTGPGLQDEPKMAIAFTCTVTDCGHRQAHVFSKRSYEKGIVIVTCSGCNNRCVFLILAFEFQATDSRSRHLIADHLGWFANLTGDGANVTIEKLAKAHGVPVTRGSIEESGVFEYDGEAPSSSSEEPPKSS